MRDRRRRPRRLRAAGGVSSPRLHEPRRRPGSDISGRVPARRSALLRLGRVSLRPRASARWPVPVRVWRRRPGVPRGVPGVRAPAVARRRRAAGVGDNHALHAPDAPPIGPDVWRALDPGALARLTLHLDPSVTLLESPWPVDAIWRANQPGADGAVDLADGAARLEVRRIDDDLVLRAMAPATF